MAENLGGTAVPTGPVNLYGFDHELISGTSTTAEFTATEITAVPEASSWGLIGFSVLGLLPVLRRKKKEAATSK